MLHSSLSINVHSFFCNLYKPTFCTQSSSVVTLAQPSTDSSLKVKAKLTYIVVIISILVITVIRSELWKQHAIFDIKSITNFATLL